MSIENGSARATDTRLPLAAGRLPFAALELREKYLLAALVVLSLAALFGPTLPAAAWPIPQYVDTRTCLGLPNAGDVLSNLAFLVMGVWGLARLHGRTDTPVGARCLFVGLILTWIGSSFYHLDPNLPQRLVADRLGMAVAFAGFLGIAVGERVSVRAGQATVMLVTVGGLLAAWVARDNLTPWVVIQFGGMALAVGLALVRPLPGALGVPIVGVLLFYVAAKLLELGDVTIFNATGHIVSGHTLKHLTAALAALPVIWALRSAARTPE